MSNRFEDAERMEQVVEQTVAELAKRFAGKPTGYIAKFEISPPRGRFAAIAVEIVALSLDHPDNENHQFACRTSCNGAGGTPWNIWELGFIEDAAAFLADWRERAEFDRMAAAHAAERETPQYKARIDELAERMRQLHDARNQERAA